jgi:hypothetical protein
LEPNQGKNPIYTLDYWWKLVLQILDIFSFFTCISAYIYFSYHLHFLLNIQFLDEYEKHEWKLYAPAKSNANNQSAWLYRLRAWGIVYLRLHCTTTVFSNCYLGLNLFCKLN